MSSRRPPGPGLVARARRDLAAGGPVTPAKAQAADLVMDLAAVEPRWRLWVLLDVVTALVVLAGPTGAARLLVVVYGLSYALGFLRLGDEPARVLAEHEPDGIASSGWLVTSVTRVTVVVLAVLWAGGSLMLAVLVGAGGLRVVGGLMVVVLVPRAVRRVLADRRARRVLAAAERESWFAGHRVDRELRAAAAQVIVHPDDPDT